MSISNVDVNRQVNAERKFLTSTEGQEYAKSLRDGLQYNDTNQDGITTGKELSADWKETLSMLAGDDKSLQARAEYLTPLFESITDKYAGDDGVMDIYEYSAILSSEDYMNLVDKYNEWFGDAFDEKFGTDIHSKNIDETEDTNKTPDEDKINAVKSYVTEELTAKREDIIDHGVEAANKNWIDGDTFTNIDDNSNDKLGQIIEMLDSITNGDISDTEDILNQLYDMKDYGEQILSTFDVQENEKYFNEARKDETLNPPTETDTQKKNPIAEFFKSLTGLFK